MITSLLTFFVVGLVALVVAGVGLALLGVFFSAAFGIGMFLLFKVVPIVLVGWLAVRFLTPRRDRISAADRKWLEEG